MNLFITYRIRLEKIIAKVVILFTLNKSIFQNTQDASISVQ